MRKQVWKNALAAFVVMATLVVTVVACDSSDNAGISTEFERMEMKFVYRFSNDLLAVADVKVTYVDPQGDNTPVTETVTTDTWAKNFVTKSIPASFTVTVAATPKTGITLDKPVYELTREISTEFLEYHNDGKIYWFDGPDVDRFTTMAQKEEANPDLQQTKINEFVAQMNRTYSYRVTVDPDGGYDVSDND